jgi:hypothetical protein
MKKTGKILKRENLLQIMFFHFRVLGYFYLGRAVTTLYYLYISSKTLRP